MLIFAFILLFISVIDIKYCIDLFALYFKIKAIKYLSFSSL